jgi:hypothetical protein
MNVRPLLGSGDADITRAGYEPYTLSGGVFVEAANVAAFSALNGTAAALTDGTTTWTAVLTSLALQTNILATEGASGDATFTRPRVTG